jgi:CxxC motif-containing protein (DUF1111 family)
MHSTALLVLSLPLAGVGACSASSGSETASSPAIVDPRLDEIFPDATAAQFAAFNAGDARFDTPFYPADGLGPLYVNISCGECHDNGMRGPGFDQRMVMVDADGVTHAADQSPIAYGNEIRARLTAGATTPVTPPDLPNVKVTIRSPPPIVGRGYMEAVLDSEIERMATEQAGRTDAIHGRVSYVTYASETTADPSFNPFVKGQMVIGRFGLKARIATLDDFCADAFQNDMGITSPLRPVEDPNPDGLTDDEKPGVDITLDIVGSIAIYMRQNAIPTRGVLTPEGAALFDQATCSVCHAPSLATRADYPIPQIAGTQAAVYTDFLLHDMGSALADGMTDGSATSTEFRTSPLIGLRYMKAFLNDGRAHTITDAIEGHGGEAAGAVRAFEQLSADDRATLLDFVGAL